MINEQRRRFPRVPSKNAVLVKKLDEESHIEGFVKTRELGLGGCMFTSDEELGVGSYLNLLISVKGKVATVIVRVIYETPQKDGDFGIGVEFIRISKEDRRLIEVLWAGGGKG